MAAGLGLPDQPHPLKDRLGGDEPKAEQAVRDLVAYSKRFNLLFPKTRLDQNKGTSENEWFVQRTDPFDKDASFQCSGIGGPLVGARLTHLIIDDPADPGFLRKSQQVEGSGHVDFMVGGRVVDRFRDGAQRGLVENHLNSFDGAAQNVLVPDVAPDEFHAAGDTLQVLQGRLQNLILRTSLKKTLSYGKIQ